jgi:hypothetical protein
MKKAASTELPRRTPALNSNQNPFVSVADDGQPFPSSRASGGAEQDRPAVWRLILIEYAAIETRPKLNAHKLGQLSGRGDCPMLVHATILPRMKNPSEGQT